MQLNPDQEAAANAIDGVWVCISGPGSGKTTVLIERFMRMLIGGIQQKDILNLTFTHAAAEEMVKRAGLINADTIFRTFHSFAMELLKKEREYLSFKLCDTVIPTGMEDYKLLFDLIKTYPALNNYRALKERISEWKRNNVEPDEAVEQSRHLKGVEYYYAAAYREYETRCRQEGWLDFDSLMREAVNLLETNDEVRNRWKRKYISVDECQDTDIVQFRFLQLIFDGNIFVVGDENQCQPPGTMVSVLDCPRQGRRASRVVGIPIEQLSETNDLLVSWDHKQKRIRLGKGRHFRRCVRQFDGNLLEILSNCKTKVTPGHFIWTKFNRGALKKRTSFVYLMWRSDLGFRVGTSTLRTSSGANQISHRGYQERAHKMWVLDIVNSGDEARILEEIYSLRYQIPERVFQCKEAKRIFNSVSQDGGFQLLLKKGLLFEHPLVSWGNGKKHITKFHGYFKTAAANLLTGLMDLPTCEPYKSALIKSIKKIEYRGPVYSLDVQEDHTYVADGVPVGNCIYEWRSAQADNLTNFEKLFPNATKLYMGQNYRSTRALVDFFRDIIPVDNGIASRMVTDNDLGIQPAITRYRDDQEEAVQVLRQITEPTQSAVLARTNRQLFLFQRICTTRGIKYRILGKKDFWEQNEVKKLLHLAKESRDMRPASTVLSDLIQQHRLLEIYRGGGTIMEGDPVENLNAIVKMSANKGTIPEFLDRLRKLTHGRKNNKGLTLSTVHQAKGREWDHVYVIGTSQGRMPHRDGEISEEKRIFFVACSRAAKTLNISFYGNHSQFLNDYIEDIIDYEPEVGEVSEDAAMIPARED